MEPYVWRMPLFSAITLGISVVVLLLCAALFHLRSRVRSQIVRGCCVAVVAVLIFACPRLFVAVAEPIVAAEHRHERYIDSEFLIAWAPALLVVLVLAGCRYLFPPRDGGVTTFRWRAGFASIVIGSAALNVTNWCSPGFCGRFGYPFPYTWWTDAMNSFDGIDLSHGTSATVLVANIAFALAGCVALCVAYRRAVTSPALSAPDPENQN